LIIDCYKLNNVSRPCWHPWLFAGDHFVMIFSSEVIILLYCRLSVASDVLWTWIYNGLWAAIWALLIIERSIPTIYLKSVTSHQFLKRMVQCWTLPVYELLGDGVKISESWSCRFLRKGGRENDSSRKLISHDGNSGTLKERKRQENSWKRYV